MYIHIARAHIHVTHKKNVMWPYAHTENAEGAQLDMLFLYVHIICYMLDAHFRCTYFMHEFRMLI